MFRCYLTGGYISDSKRVQELQSCPKTMMVESVRFGLNITDSIDGAKLYKCFPEDENINKDKVIKHLGDLDKKREEEFRKKQIDLGV